MSGKNSCAIIISCNSRPSLNGRKCVNNRSRKWPRHQRRLLSQAVSWDVTHASLTGNWPGPQHGLWWSRSATGPLCHQWENFSTDLPCLFLTELRVLPLLTHELSYDSLHLPRALAQAAEGADWRAPYTPTRSVASTSSTPTQVPIQVSPIRMSSSPEGSSARSLHGGRNLRVWVLPPGIGSDTPSFSFLCTLYFRPLGK